jgi:hypothetical protein
VRVLHLTLKREPFDAIALGKKRVEFRARTAYWKARLFFWRLEQVSEYGGREKLWWPRVFDEVNFRNGYRKDSLFMRVEWKGVRIGLRKDNYEILLGKVLEIRNWSGPKGEKA